MRCPYCGKEEDRVVDSRPNRDNTAIRRRRCCDSCGQRFTTYEYVELIPVQIIKKDGRREDFSREKILNGLRMACRKRSIPVEQIEKIVENLQDYLARTGKSEVPSKLIGERIMKALQKLDKVAYVRFASVYKEFKDLNEFKKTIDKLFPDTSE